MPNLLLTEIFPPRPGGSGRWFFEVYRRFREPSIVVTEAQPNNNDVTDLGKIQLQRTAFEIKETGGLTVSGLIQYLRLVRKLRKIAGGSQIPLANAGRVLPEGWALFLWKSLFRGPAYQVFAHGEEINLSGASAGGVMSSGQHRLMAKLVFRNAERIIANSENTKSILCDQWSIPTQKVTGIHRGVDTDFFKPSKNSKPTNWPEKWDGRFVVLTVGRLQRRKGQDMVIRSLTSLTPKIPNLLYVVAGSGEDRDHLRKLAKDLNVRQHVDFVESFNDEDLLSMYQSCDLFILANRQIGSDIEGFGMVLLEAAACEKATITGQSGGTKEAILDGETGLLVNAEKEKAITAAILELHDDPQRRTEMGKKGRLRAVKQFDWKSLAHQMQRLN